MVRNVVMLCRLFTPHSGGVEKHVELLSKELLKRGHSIVLITEQYSLDLPLEEIIEGVKVIRIPYFALNSKRLVWTWMCEHENLFADADSVHVHDVFWWYWPIRILLLFKPVFITFHGYEGRLPSLSVIFQRRVSELVSNGSLCVGDYLRKWYRAKPVFVTYGASKVLNNKSVLDGIVYIGRYDEDTGVRQYLDVCKNLTGFGNIHFYGNGPLREVIQKEQTKNKNIKLHGWTLHPEKVLLRCRYVFASQYLSILEAMQARKLVFAVYNNEIKKDYLMCHPMHDNMIIAGTASELVKKFNEIKKNPAKEKRMVDAAYAWAKEQTWEKLADQYEQLWAR